MSKIRLSGGAARNFMAERMVEHHGLEAVNRVSGPMKEVVREVARRECGEAAVTGAEAPMTVQQIEQWIEACNHEPARAVLREYLQMKAVGG